MLGGKSMRISLGEEVLLLQTVYVTDFGDNYHRTEDEPSSELEKEARRIRRRYKSIADYMAALAIYNEYMAMLAVKHGSPQLLKIKIDNDAIDDFIPAKPRMKNTPHNKMLLKKGIMVSSININKINYDNLEDTLDALEEDLTGEEEIVADTDMEEDKIAKKLIKKGHFNRVSINKVKEIDNIDFLEEYFATKNSIQREEEEEEVASISVTAIANGKYDEMVRDTTEDDDIIYYRGNYMDRQTVEDLRIYQDLGERGWNSVKLMKEKGLSKRMTKVLKAQTKKNKDKDEDKTKMMDAAGDAFFISLGMDNDHDSFGSYQEEMSNFTAANIMRG